MATNSVNFFQPGTDAAIDANGIMRQRELAKLLALKGQQSPEGSMVSGHYVAPGAMSYVNQLAQALSGKYLGDKADAGEREMGARLQAQRAAESQAFMQAMQGTPAASREIDGPAAPGQAAPSQTTAAVPGDPNRAMALALQSQNPALQGMGGDLMKRQLDASELKSALQSAGIGGGGPQPEGGGAMASGGASNPAGSPGGVPAGLSPQAFALTMSRNPQAQALGKMIQEASKPQTITEGGAIGRYGPNGQWIPDYIAPKTEAGIGVVPLAGQPGAFRANPVHDFGRAKADIAGQVAGAEAAARDPYAAPITVPSATGPRLMMPSQVRAEAQGGVGNGGGPVNGQPVQNPMAPRPGDTDRGMIYKQELDAAAERMSAAQKAGDQAAFARAQQDIGALLKEVKSNKIQLPQQAPQPAAAAAPTGAGIALQRPEDEAYKTTRAKGYAELAPKLQQTGQSGASTLRQLDELKQLYSDPNVAKGALAESFSGLKNLGTSFGIDMKGLSSEQAAAAITNKMALDFRSTADGAGMPGAMSDADREFLKALTPNLSKSPEGRVKIMDAQAKVAQRQIDVARLANQYEQQHGRIDAGFDKVVQEYASKNKMFTQPTKGGGFKILEVK